MQASQKLERVPSRYANRGMWRDPAARYYTDGGTIEIGEFFMVTKYRKAMSIALRCSNYRETKTRPVKCQVNMEIGFDGSVIRRTGIHTHPPEENGITIRAMRHELIAQARQVLEEIPLPEKAKEVIEHYPADVVARLPKNFIHTMYRHRKQAEAEVDLVGTSNSALTYLQVKMEDDGDIEEDLELAVEEPMVEESVILDEVEVEEPVPTPSPSPPPPVVTKQKLRQKKSTPAKPAIKTKSTIQQLFELISSGEIYEKLGLEDDGTQLYACYYESNDSLLLTREANLPKNCPITE